MKKQTLTLALCLLVVVLLAITLLVVIQDSSSPQDQTPGESQSDSGLTLQNLTANDLNTLHITNPTGSYTLLNLGDSFGLEGYEDIPTSTTVVEELTSALAPLRASALIWEPEEEPAPGQSQTDPALAQYGLDSPEVFLQVVTVSQQNFTLALGDEAPSSSGVYALYQGRVYLLDSSLLDTLSRTAFSFVDNRILGDAPESYDNASLVLSGSVRPSPITVQIKEVPPDNAQDDSGEEPTGQTQYAYTLTTPVERTLPAQPVVDLLSNLFPFYANSIAAVHPTAEDLLNLGLSQPFSTFQLNLEGESFTLHASQPTQEGLVYLMREGTPIVYTAYAGRLDWLTLQYEQLIQAVYTPSDVSEVETLTVEGTGQAYWFAVEHLSSGGMEVTCNGQAVDGAVFTQLYQTITPIPPTSYTQESPTLSPVLTITVGYTKEGRERDVIQLIPTGTGELYLSVNSKVQYTAGEELVELILQNCQNALEGKELTPLS